LTGIDSDWRRTYSRGTLDAKMDTDGYNPNFVVNVKNLVAFLMGNIMYINPTD
jgi:hypothetical protein